MPHSWPDITAAMHCCGSELHDWLEKVSQPLCRRTCWLSSESLRGDLCAPQTEVPLEHKMGYLLQ